MSAHLGFPNPSWTAIPSLGSEVMGFGTSEQILSPCLVLSLSPTPSFLLLSIQLLPRHDSVSCILGMEIEGEGMRLINGSTGNTQKGTGNMADGSH